MFHVCMFGAGTLSVSKSAAERRDVLVFWFHPSFERLLCSPAATVPKSIEQLERTAFD